MATEEERLNCFTMPSGQSITGLQGLFSLGWDDVHNMKEISFVNLRDEYRFGVRSRGGEKGSRSNPQKWQENSYPASSSRIGWCLGDRAFVAVTQECAAIA